MDNEEDWMDKIKGFYDKYGEGIRRNVEKIFSVQGGVFDDNELVRDTLNPFHDK